MAKSKLIKDTTRAKLFGLQRGWRPLLGLCTKNSPIYYV